MTPLEHTAIDTALTATVRANTIPILPQIVDHLLTPDDDGDGRLADDGRLSAKDVAKAIEVFAIDTQKPNPLTV